MGYHRQNCRNAGNEVKDAKEDHGAIKNCSGVPFSVMPSRLLIAFDDCGVDRAIAIFIATNDFVNLELTAHKIRSTTVYPSLKVGLFDGVFEIIVI